MGLFDSLFGKRKPASAAQLKSESSGDETTIGMIVVFDRVPTYTPESLQATLREMSPQLNSASVEGLEGTYEQGTPVSRISWGEHAIDMVGMNCPLPPAVVENCVAAAHYGQDRKAAVRAHKAHAMLYYGGTASSPIEQYLSLAAVGAALSKHHALAVLNESALTSLPADMLYEFAQIAADLTGFRELPLLMLYCGFVKYFLPNNQGTWMRTYNCPRVGLPDLAMFSADARQAKGTFDLFTGLLNYLQSSGKHFSPGHTAEFGETHIRFRAPRDDEPFPTHTEGKLLIIELRN